jgi:hypothetical protein
MVIGTSFCSEAGGGQERNAAPAAHGLNASLLFVAHVNFECITSHNLIKSLKIFKNGNLLLLDLNDLIQTAGNLIIWYFLQ